jgi:hypothetical protein
MRDDRAGTVVDRAHVDVSDAVEQVLVHHLQRQGRLGDAGIVYQYVEAAKGRAGEIGGRYEALQCRNVADDRPHILADLARDPRSGSFVAVHEHDQRTLGDEFPDDAFTKTRTATGDDGDLASKSHICSSVVGTIGEVSRIAQSDYLNALLAFLV